MHNNYYFLKQLSKSLEAILEGAVVSECFSQNKDELIVRFETTGRPFFIKAGLQSTFSCLSFPDTFNRARKNSVDLFTPLIGRRVVHVRQFSNERSFALAFTDGWHLLFKLHGNRSNILLFEQERVHELFKKNIRGDATLNMASLDRTIDWRYEHFLAHRHALKKVYFTFGKVVWRYLEEDGFEARPPEEKWEILQQLLQQLEDAQCYITEQDEVPVLSMIPFGEVKERFTDPVRAVNTFFQLYVQADAYRKEKRAALNTLRARLSGCEGYIGKLAENLHDTVEHNQYKVWADVLMANLHAVRPGMATVELPNFYDHDAPVSIKLKKELSAQKNAEIFYRKAKNQAIEIRFLQQTLEAREKEAAALRDGIAHIEGASGLAALRDAVQSLRLGGSVKTQPVSRPYHELEYRGYTIRVGKTAAGNDALTLKHSYKEDLWLHAKDVAGSHVVIKHQAGKKIPADVVERAAQIAAYNSKRKTESLCPVIVTPKKFVRKRKGDPPGAVVVEREEVIMVEPRM